MGHPQETDAEEVPIGVLMQSALADAQILLSDQIELASIEIRNAAISGVKSSGMLITGIVFAALGALLALFTAGFGLEAAGLSAWAAFGIVTLALFAIGGVLAATGAKKLSKIPKPKRTIKSLNETKAALRPAR